MQRLDVNLATRPVRNTTLVWSGYAVAAVLLAAATWANVSAYREHRALGRDLASQAGSFESQRRELETRGERARVAIERYDVPALHLQAAKANEIIDWKAFSWTRLFNLMERIQPGAVRMNGVRPVFYGSGEAGDPRAEGTSGWGLPVSVEGTARNLAEIADFEQSLQDDPHVAFILPERLSRADSGEILFQLRFHYRPDLDAAKDTEPPPATAAGPPARSRAEASEAGASGEAEPVDVADPWAEAGAAPGEPGGRAQGRTP